MLPAHLGALEPPMSMPEALVIVAGIAFFGLVAWLVGRR